MRTARYSYNSLYKVKRALLSPMARRKRVAIIGQFRPLVLEVSNAESPMFVLGGGPAGLVTAKTLLHDSYNEPLEPFIFERKHGVGGLWNVSAETTSDDIVSTEMPTNISRYTCAFSDLAWESINLGNDSPGVHVDLPMFPKARHVKRYLETYANWYIPAKHIGLDCNVIRTTPYNHNGVTRWSVEWEVSPGASVPSFTSLIGAKETSANTGPCRYEAEFDYLVVASGFFAVPKMLDIPGIGEFSTKAKLKHSSKLRDLHEDLVDGGSGKIVIVGGSMSGVEAAATVAFQLSSAKHAPGNGKDFSKYTVHHLTSKPFWVLPPYVLRQVPPGEKEGIERTSPGFLPLEMAGNNLSTRTEEVVSYRPSKEVSQTSIKWTNTRISQMLGTEQETLGDGTLSFQGQRMDTKLPWIAVSPTYAGFVQSGDIRVHLGSVVNMNATTLAASGDVPFQLNDVALLVVATGFDPHASLSFLPSEVLQSLGYNAQDNYEPLSRDRFGVRNEKQPHLGFVGFYRGPWFGVMEMQARYLGKLWSDECPAANATGEHNGQKPPLTNEKLPRGQFPMADYVGLMESLARETGVRRIPIPGLPEKNCRGQGVVVASRYPSPNISDRGAEEVEKTLRSLAHTLGLAPPDSPSQEPGICTPNLKLLSPATFRALQGNWNLYRTLNSALPQYPSGTFRGTASFHPRDPTAPEYSAEMLYVEDGELTTLQGFVMRGHRRYVYRLKDGAGISSWFVKSDGLTVDYLFHTLAFEIDEHEGWKAIGSSHLCLEDYYESDYRFYFNGVNIKKWELGYQVNGPKKDYSTKSTFSRP